MKKHLAVAALALFVALGAAACKKKDAPAAEAAQSYAVVGVVKGFQADGKVIILDHQKIEGLMDAMTMGFELADPALAKGLKAGDKVTATLSKQNELYKLTALSKQ